MNKIAKRLLSAFTAAAITISAVPAVLAADDDLTRGEAARMLLTAADDYNADVELSDIIKGYEDGELHEDNPVTRAEALVMLKRAFGELPELTGHNARVAIPKEDFTDIPDWAVTELSDVFDAGIVAGTSTGIFSPNETVTKSQMELFIERVYSIFGTNYRDDFYATVNKDALEEFTFDAGESVTSTLKLIGKKASDNVTEIINEIAAGTYEQGTKEQKIADTYNNYINTDARNSRGIEQIQEYLDMIDSAESTADLVNVQCELDKNLVLEPFFVFGITPDFDDATAKVLDFSQYPLSYTKETYLSGTDTQKTAYTNYIKNLFDIAGVENAADAAQAVYDAEVTLAEASLDSADSNNIDLINNKYTLDELKAIFAGVDLDAVLAASGYTAGESIIVEDKGYMEKFAEFFCDDNLDVLKNMARKQLLVSIGTALSESFTDAANTLNAEFYGASGAKSVEETAADNVMTYLADYLSELYAERYFSAEAKADVESMIDDILAVYRERIQNLTWMSDATKQNAIKKLDAFNIMVGYPDSWDTALDNAEILSVENGGSYFDNIVAICKAYRDKSIAEQNEPVDKTEWEMSVYTANAYYQPLTNSIAIPAGILMDPIYDINASYEEKMGGIGFAIAHEITHAFDSSGSKFDENGNAVDWWTEEDRAAFDELCQKVVEYYDGAEGVPGVAISGTLTLGENIADLGSISCVTELVSKRENPDFEALYKNIAITWAGTMSREYAEYLAKNDVHSQYKLRANLTVKTVDEFYETFGVTEGDGMYLAPEDRVKIW